MSGWVPCFPVHTTSHCKRTNGHHVILTEWTPRSLMDLQLSSHTHYAPHTKKQTQTVMDSQGWKWKWTPWCQCRDNRTASKWTCGHLWETDGLPSVHIETVMDCLHVDTVMDSLKSNELKVSHTWTGVHTDTHRDTQWHTKT